jgi:molybdate transport system substrate-binding protein
MEEAMKSKLFVMAVLASAVAGPVTGAEVKVLSAGAVEPGLMAAADLFRKKTGHEVSIRFATAPAIRERVSGGDTPDVVLAPPAVVDELAKVGKLDATQRVTVGRVGVGVAVRLGAPVPDVSNSDALKRSVAGAESLVYNQASTGTYVEGLFQRLGISEEVRERTKRYPDGDAVMAHLIKGSGREIGFGAITEIMLYNEKGLRFVGPLPRDVQNYTTYAAASVIGTTNPSVAKEFLDFLGGPEAKGAFTSKGIE